MFYQLAEAAPGDLVLHGIEKLVFWVVLIILGVSHLAHLCIKLLHWPKWLVNHFTSAEQNHTAQIVRETLLAYINENKRRDDEFRTAVNKAAVMPDHVDACRNLLAIAYTSTPVSVGRGEPTVLPYYVNMMSCCLDPLYCDRCASVLASFMKRQPVLSQSSFDRIIGIKGGSPTLAVALARRLNIKISLFRGKDSPKHQQDNSDVVFDGDIVAGERVLIVDDSTTGGRMMIEAITELEKGKVEINHALVIFEPIGKNARQKLAAIGVELWSVIKMDDPELSIIRGIVSAKALKRAHPE